MYSIEFLGLPGSGKTTLCNNTARYLENEGANILSHRNFYQILNDYYLLDSKNSGKVKIYRRVYVYSWFLRFAISNLRYVSLCLFSIFNMNVKYSLKVRFLRWLIKEGAAWQFFSKLNISHKIVINDEGFIHRAISMGHGSVLSDQYIKKYFAVCPVSDVVIKIDVDWMELLSRRTVSSEPFALIFNVKDEKSREYLITKMNVNLKNIISLFPNSRKMIVIDGNIDPIANVNKILESINIKKS
jgi:hypothetical protein